jgi:hypothetical protein
MKKIGHLIKKIRKIEPASRAGIDQETIFFIFKKIICEMYGNKGVENILPKKYSNHILYFSTFYSLWSAEILINRGEILNKINEKVGSQEVMDIKNSN